MFVRLFRYSLLVVLVAGMVWVAQRWFLVPIELQTRAIPREHQLPQLPRISLETDPQYIVINFAPMNEYSWHAPESEWQQTIKPLVRAELQELKAALPAGTDQRKLAWSTLLEYMNFPLDEPSSNSAYVVKVRRIFEVAQAEDLPVFLPLNGFQWWDELPELYNWWDSDGTQTDPRFFARQDKPAEFKQRFIAGYDPDNVNNVEWQDWQTPMALNWRNWGGGGFRLAPPPSIVATTKLNKRGLSYRSVQRERFAAIIQEIVQQVQTLEKNGKSELFAGISIGTEVSLNASATQRDEFEPYGYRAMLDLLEREQASSSALTTDIVSQQHYRQQAVREYLFELSWLAVQLGLPTQRIYTHVWSEALAGEARYVDYAAAAYNPYSRPGISLYGYATKPFQLPVWRKALLSAGMPAWGAVELSLPKDAAGSMTATDQLATPVGEHQPAQVAVLYNWDEHNNPENRASLRQLLSQNVVTSPCDGPEIFQPQVVSEYEQYVSIVPVRFEWRWEKDKTVEKDAVTSIQLYKGARVTDFARPDQTIELPIAATESATVPELEPGVYTWIVETQNCQATIRRSQPQQLVIPRVKKHFLPQWTSWTLDLLEFFSVQQKK